MKEERQRLNAPASENVRLDAPIGHGMRVFLVFLVCCAVFVAVFAVSRILPLRQSGGASPEVTGGSMASAEDATSHQPSETDAPIPDGAVAIRTVDLSGDAFQNETSYVIDPVAVRALFGGDTRRFSPEEPVVLILHTHAQEGYRTDGTPYLTGGIGDAIYTEDRASGVVAVGEVLCRELMRGGVPAIHCTDLHGEGGTLRGAYDGAAECIRRYMEEYPSIAYVIDLHRDSVLSADGACLRTLSESGSAQIMAVVGSDGGGEACPAWRENLGLALTLSECLNAASAGVSRPVLLRNATYNQEIAPHSLLLEIGSAGNTVTEAKSAAVLVGKVLAELLCGRDSGQ